MQIMALAHLVQNPALVQLVSERQKLPECDLQGMEIYREIIDFCAKHPNMTTAQLLELWRDHPAQPHLRTLAIWPIKGESSHQVQEFKDALIGLELEWTRVLRARMKEIVSLSKEEKEMHSELLRREQELKQLLAQ